MTTIQIQQWIQHPELLNKETLYELRNQVARYPYFQTLRLLYLKNLYLLHAEDFGAELRKAVPYVADRRVLFQLLEGESFRIQLKQEKNSFTNRCEEEPNVDRTLSLIDAFLSSVPEEKQTSASSTPIGTEFVMDYTTYLLQDDSQTIHENDAIPLRGQGLIDDFIQHSENTESKSIFLQTTDFETQHELEIKEFSQDDELDEACFTETLAKIYVKQQRYEKALEIIRKLSLIYPKKNAYFADQIRFLEKLIINDKFK